MIGLVVTAMLLVSVVLAAARALRGDGLADVVVGVDVLLLALISLIAVDAAVTQRSTYLDLPLVVGLLGFLGTSTAAVYLRRRENREEDR